MVLKTVFFCTFLRLKKIVLEQNIMQNLLLFVYFCPKNSTVDSGKTSITQEWLVVESYPTPR